MAHIEPDTEELAAPQGPLDSWASAELADVARDFDAEGDTLSAPLTADEVLGVSTDDVRVTDEQPRTSEARRSATTRRPFPWWTIAAAVAVIAAILLAVSLARG